MNHPRLAALALFFHPLLVVGLIFNFEIRPGWPSGVVAYLLELILAGGLTYLLVPWMRSVSFPGTSEAPESVDLTLDGFQATFALPFDPGRHAAAGVIGLLLSAAGACFVGFFALIIASLGSVTGGVSADLIPTAIAVAFLAHAVLQALPMAAILAARARRATRRTRRTVQLAGRVLRVDGESMPLTGSTRLTRSIPDGSLTIEDSGKRFVVWGKRSEMDWLARRLSRVESQGSEQDVPETLARVTARQEA